MIWKAENMDSRSETPRSIVAELRGFTGRYLAQYLVARRTAQKRLDSANQPFRPRLFCYTSFEKNKCTSRQQ